jgi:pyridoxine kinase
MAKVLSISSQVVYGHVGNSTAVFVLQRMGHEVVSLPTILLSSRPGYGAIAGSRLDPDLLDAMLDAAQRNGELRGIDAIMTGYVPTAEHVALAATWIAKIKELNPSAIYLCDPIIGDEPAGIYIDEAAAEVILQKLVPLADILTPNRFELEWLAGWSVPNAAATVDAARSLLRPAVVVTSAPVASFEKLANILVEGVEAAATVSPRQSVRAHGTGDFFAAIFLAHRLNGRDNRTALRAASTAMGPVLAASRGRAELALIETQAIWAQSPPPLAPLASLGGLS